MTQSSDHLPSVSSVSSISSISLMEVKADTHLVLKAFLHRTLATPHDERPGRVGGAYKDHTKYSCIPMPNSQTEDVNSADEKKSGLKGFIKQLPRRNTSNKSAKNSLERDSKNRVVAIREHSEGDVVSPSASSDEDDSEKKQKKKLNPKRIKERLSKIFKGRTEKEKEKEREREIEKEREKEKERDGVKPQRPTTLAIKESEPDLTPTLISPSHPPEFYDEVAEKLEQIAQKSTSIKKPAPIVQSPQMCEKEVVVQKLVQILSMEGDAMNKKIESDPSFRTSLNRLSYRSYARLMDTFSKKQVEEAPPLPPPSSSPTLRRMAVTMVASRRIVTATGTQHMQGYADRYMETYAPWVKSHGGWENIIDLEEESETE